MAQFVHANVLQVLNANLCHVLDRAEALDLEVSNVLGKLDAVKPFFERKL